MVSLTRACPLKTFQGSNVLAVLPPVPMAVSLSHHCPCRWAAEQQVYKNSRRRALDPLALDALAVELFRPGA